jgi:hypothetical protein
MEKISYITCAENDFNKHDSKKYKLNCKCGKKEFINSNPSFKIFENNVNKSSFLYDDSKLSIKCSGCQEVYDEKNKIYYFDSKNLVVPKKITYKYNNDFDNIYLYKKIECYKKSDKEDGVLETNVTDYIRIDIKNKKTFIYKDYKHIQTKSREEEIDLKNTEDKLGSSSHENNCLMDFFGNKNIFEDSIYNIIDIKKFFIDLSNIVVDFEKLSKNVLYINSLYSILSSIEYDENSKKYIHFVDSGFNDGSKLKRNILINELFHLFNKNIKVLINCLIFPEISNIIFTKGIIFYNDFIESELIAKKSFYLKLNSTSPSKILSTSILYKNEEKNLETEIKEKEDFLISKTIFNNIKTVNHLIEYFKIIQKKFDFLRKENIEYLFQKYPNKDVNKFLENLNKTNTFTINNANTIEKPITFRNIEHLFVLNLDSDSQKSPISITHYFDTHNLYFNLRENVKNIFKIKKYSELKQVHDELSIRYNAIIDEEKSKKYKETISKYENIFNKEIDDISFELIEDSIKLNQEGVDMKHCIYSYLGRIANGTYLAISINHKITKERATLGIVVDEKTFMFEQLKGFCNSRATQELINTTLKYLKSLNVSNINKTFNDLTINKSKQKMMPNQMSEKDLEIYRKKNEKKVC